MLIFSLPLTKNFGVTMPILLLLLFYDLNVSPINGVENNQLHDE